MPEKKNTLKEKVITILKYFGCEEDIDLSQYKIFTKDSILEIASGITEDLDDFEGTYSAYEYNLRHYDCAYQLENLAKQIK